MKGGSPVISIVNRLQRMSTDDGLGTATVFDWEGSVIGVTTDDIILQNMMLDQFTITRSSTPGPEIGSITDGSNNEPIYAGDEITFSNLQL